MNAEDTFEARAAALQDELAKRGYTRINKPVNIGRYVDADLITDCEIIARKDFFNMLYLEARSNWKRVAGGAARTQNGPCVVFTRYDASRTIVTILTNRLSPSPKPRHLVISSPSMLKKFLDMIRVAPNDTVETVDKKVTKAFDKLSAYEEALKEFASNLDEIINATKALIELRIKNTPKYAAEAKAMLQTCHDVVSDKMSIADIKDMLIQHVITYKIFKLVYDNTDFHTTNVVAKLLERLRAMLKIPDDVVNYKTLELIAESLTETDEQQEFLQNLYEVFYKKYDPEKTLKDGIVYTPKQAVGFMIRSVEILLKRHFGKGLSDDNVHILDPATGTGTFMVGILRAITPSKLNSKYTHELHANEIYILPYYIAALNIEHVYHELSGAKTDFPGICWTDTLDIKQGIEEFIDDDNAKRISRQRKQPIFVVIGNPPYSVAKNSVATWYPNLYQSIQNEWRSDNTNAKVNLDLYKVFLKWSSERIKKYGIVAFISNSSFINSAGDFKMRESICKKFDHIYVINLKGNTRLATWKEEGGKVFGGQARVGVCISFFIKTGENTNNLQYSEVQDYMNREEKLNWLETNDIGTVRTSKITPKQPKWDMCPSAPRTNWPSLIPLLSEDTVESVFSKYLLGVQTNKDRWVYGDVVNDLENRIKFYIDTYNTCVLTRKVNCAIKLTSDMEKNILKHTNKSDDRNKLLSYSKLKIKHCMYRPFVKKLQYTDNAIIHRVRPPPKLSKFSNVVIMFPNHTPNAEFGTFITDMLINSGCIGETRGISLYVENDDLNVTKWALDVFRTYYNNKSISSKDLFYYTYAILNDPKYIKEYAHDLKTSFPRIPLAESFDSYKKLGAKLASIHIDYEQAKPYPLKRVDTGQPPKKTKLSIKDNKIVVDDATVLEGLPVEATQYMIGTKSALGWVLEFYKESKHLFKVGRGDKYDTCDQKVANRFNTYRFTEHKEDAIDLIRRITTVSVETMQLKQRLKNLQWGPQPLIKFTRLMANGDEPVRMKPSHSMSKKNKHRGVNDEKNSHDYNSLGGGGKESGCRPVQT